MTSESTPSLAEPMPRRVERISHAQLQAALRVSQAQAQRGRHAASQRPLTAPEGPADAG